MDQVQTATQSVVYQPPFGVKTNKELAQKLSWKSVKLLTLLGKTKSEHYSIISLKKKGSNSKRILHNPDGLMRKVQYKILTTILNKIEVPEYIHAFEKGKSIPKMAQCHVGKAIVVSIDLKDFFTSIKQYRLVELFTHIGFGPDPARLLSELCTYKSFVPQGALTSPKLSNIVTALTYGPSVYEYCSARGFSMSIYADDITVSLTKEQLEKHGGSIVAEIIAHVSRQAQRYRFRVNTAKTKVMRTYQRQYVCGVVVNSKVNLQKSERNKLRAIVHNCLKNGIEAEAAKSSTNTDMFYSSIMGRLNWFSQLNPQAGDRLKQSMTRKADEEQGQPIASSGAVETVMSADTTEVHPGLSAVMTEGDS